MSKKVRVHSAIHILLRGMQRARFEGADDLNFYVIDANRLQIGVKEASSPLVFDARELKLYRRSNQTDPGHEGEVLGYNEAVIQSWIEQIRAAFGSLLNSSQSAVSLKQPAEVSRPVEYEREFHDRWAQTEEVEKVDVHLSNYSPTAPELRFIHSQFPDLRGKRVLDFGCGLGEASVAFAEKGANVVAMDISPEMLNFASQLARSRGVQIETKICVAEHFNPASFGQFDLIYAGNIFHHINLSAVLPRLIEALKPDGSLVSWDPVAYNPIINLYRIWAHKVRTYDERPFSTADIAFLRRYFGEDWTWVSTLVLFPLMFLIDRQSPNSVRYWKKVVREGERWRWIYEPLEKLDRILLRIFPPIRYLCWNVTLICKNPRKQP
jgi:2-polyprenyl-3-methyl-5-hydroxy-6-metoxy-1,4-benzoquinol methylase